MGTTIKKRVTKHSAITVAERGLLSYMLDTRAKDGTFQRHYTDIANEINSTPSSIHRYMKGLIKKNAVKILVKSQHGRDGYPIPAILKPIPQMESAHSTDETGSVNGASAKSPQKVERDKPLDSKERQPIPLLQKPVPNGTQKLTTDTGHSSLSVRTVRENEQQQLVTVGDESKKSFVLPEGYKVRRVQC